MIHQSILPTLAPGGGHLQACRGAPAHCSHSPVGSRQEWQPGEKEQSTCGSGAYLQTSHVVLHPLPFTESLSSWIWFPGSSGRVPSLLNKEVCVSSSSSEREGRPSGDSLMELGCQTWPLGWVLLMPLPTPTRVAVKTNQPRSPFHLCHVAQVLQPGGCQHS